MILIISAIFMARSWNPCTNCVPSKCCAYVSFSSATISQPNAFAAASKELDRIPVVKISVDFLAIKFIDSSIAGSFFHK